MDFAVSGPVVRRLRLVPDVCPSTRTFAIRFLQTSPRGDSPCVVANPSPPSGWVEDFHLQATEQPSTPPNRSALGFPRKCSALINHRVSVSACAYAAWRPMASDPYLD